MRTSFLAVQLVVSSSFSWAFTTRSTFVTKNKIATPAVTLQKPVLFSQWDDEDEEEKPAQTTSFDDAGEVLRKEDDDSMMEEMEDFDSNPLVRIPTNREKI